MREEWRGAYLQGVVFFAPMSLPPLPQSGRRRGGIGLLLSFFLLRSPYLPPHSTLLQDPTLLLLLLFQLSHGRGFSVRRRLLFHHRLFLRRRSPESAYSQGRRRGKCFSAEWKGGRGGCPILSGRRRRRTAKVLRRGTAQTRFSPKLAAPGCCFGEEYVREEVKLVFFYVTHTLDSSGEGGG